MRRGAKPAKPKVEARSSVARKSLRNDGSRVRDLEKRLAESLEREKATGEILQEKDRALAETLEQQTATAEILRVISRSHTDVQPVFDTIVRNAGRVCDAVDAVLILRQDDEQTVGGHWGPIEAPLGSRFPLTRGSVMGRAIIDTRPIHVEDLLTASEFPEGREWAIKWGHRTTLAVPLLRDGDALGALLIRRSEVRPFSDGQIAMLQTFADQAVIAIENVRMFKELEASNRDLTEALEQQTATSEILRVISQSPTDLEPVLDTVVANAARLCESVDAQIFRIDGDVLRLAASFGSLPKTTAGETRPINRGSVNGRAVVERRTIHIHDLAAESETEWPVAISFQRRFGHRSIVATPLLREGTPIGAITIRRMEVRPFSDKQIALLQTFADQAVIAIENVRLFTELQGKNSALTAAHAQVTEALEQQTAASEILRVISSSPTDVQPVFDTILRSAVRLCNGQQGTAWRFDGELMYLAAHDNLTPENLRIIHQMSPMRPDSRLTSARAIVTRGVVHVEDVLADPEYAHPVARAGGFRSVLAVPMLREANSIGAIVVHREQAGPFPAAQIELLKTFADQAVIAVENVRLFKELEEKNRALTEAHAQVSEALERQTTTAEILRVISGSLTDTRPVFDIIAASALRLCGAGYGQVALYDGEWLHLVALDNVNPEGVEALRRRFPVRAEPGSAMGRAIHTRAVVSIPDVLEDPAYAFKSELVTMGFRGLLVVPMLRESKPIGAIAVGRAEPGLFSDRQIELLQTFAEQAVIAIENVRLFKELQTRTAELTRSVDQLTALGEVGRAVSSTLDLETVLTTIVSRAVQLLGPVAGAIYEYDEGAEEFHLRATENFEAEYVELLRAMPIRKGEGALGRVALTQQPVQIPDFTQEGTYQSRFRDALTRLGYRALLAVPLLREDHIIGGLVINGKTPGEFPSEVIDLLKTFASQSALAIQNARLFHEIADKSRQLEAASQHKSEFLANMSHELRTPLNAIIGFSEVLVDRMFGELNEKQDEYLKDIYASGQHLLSLINDILDLSKIEAGRMELEVTDFDLPGAIGNALTLVRERASRRGITLGHAVDERLGQIRGDERKVKQVLLNLLSNALKFTPEGGRIDVSARVHDGVAEVSVADTGVGIAPEDQEAVFEEFRQVGTADKKVEGTGLGLALARKCIELHGGRIWVESEVGKGSTFTFTLPVRS
jgi:two-component system, NtrC family, sensor kinase